MRFQIIATVLLALSFTILVAFTEFEDPAYIPGWHGSSKWSIQSETITGNSGRFLLAAQGPTYRKVTIRTRITVIKAVSENWKTAGIAFFKDACHYWLLSFVERPDRGRDPQEHYIELRCMRKCRWGVLAGVKNLVWKDFTWDYGTTYDVELKFERGHITGCFYDESNQLLGKMEYRLGPGTQQYGIPALYTRGCIAEFTDISIEGED